VQSTGSERQEMTYSIEGDNPLRLWRQLASCSRLQDAQHCCRSKRSITRLAADLLSQHKHSDELNLLQRG
jgi:hypothetical protein